MQCRTRSDRPITKPHLFSLFCTASLGAYVFEVGTCLLFPHQSTGTSWHWTSAARLSVCCWCRFREKRSAGRNARWPCSRRSTASRRRPCRVAVKRWYSALSSFFLTFENPPCLLTNGHSVSPRSFSTTLFLALPISWSTGAWEEPLYRWGSPSPSPVTRASWIRYCLIKAPFTPLPQIAFFFFHGKHYEHFELQLQL